MVDLFRLPARLLLPSALVVAATLAGCSPYVTGDPKTPVVGPGGGAPEFAAKVCLARNALLAQAVAASVRDNGHLVGVTQGHSHFCWLAAPGEHVIATTADDEIAVRFAFEAGTTYYLRHAYVFSFFRANFRAEPMDDDEGKNAIASSNYVTLERVATGEEIPNPLAVVAAAPHEPSVPTGFGVPSGPGTPSVTP
ncbi:MAG: hypothetical protein U0169_06065 [Polyangiaceae bacterium]